MLGLAAGNYQSCYVVELLGLFHENDFRAEFFEALAVGIEIALQS